MLIGDARMYNVLYFADADEAVAFSDAIRLFVSSELGRPLLTTEPRAVLWQAASESDGIEFISDTDTESACDVTISSD